MQYIQWPVHTISKTSSMSLGTRYILLSSSMYFKTYISDQYVLICTGYIHGTYLRKIVCTWYILGVKSMCRVHTGLCRIIAVPYYSMVHTGLYSVHTGMNLVHTTGHDSRCFLDSIASDLFWIVVKQPRKLPKLISAISKVRGFTFCLKWSPRDFVSNFLQTPYIFPKKFFLSSCHVKWLLVPSH